jgi:tryptophan 2,3-dioxygenase
MDDEPAGGTDYEIGSRPGTGGSRGVEYLRSTVDRRFFQEHWEVRVAL